MSKSNGFTLIEVAIVLVIAGLLFGTASSLLLLYMNQAQVKTTRQRTAAIDEALQLFLNLNGRYPCPASIEASSDTADFGVEVASGFPVGSPKCSDLSGTINGTREAPGILRNFGVRIGAVPVRTLNLPDEFIADAWGRRFTFAMTERLASSGTYDRDEGDIDIIDSNGNYIVNPSRDPAAGLAHYVIVSHGKNGSGGTPIGGGNSTFPCVAADLEGENCNNDAIFRKTMLFSTGTSSMDDYIGFRATTAFGGEIPPGAVMAFNLHSCPTGWVEYSAASGRIIVGVGNNGDGIDYTLGQAEGKAITRPDEDEVGIRFTPTGVDFPSLPVGATNLAIPGAHSDHENRPPVLALRYCMKT